MTKDRRKLVPLDPETGFPVIPDDHFWKVERNRGIIGDIIGVSLYRTEIKVSKLTRKTKIKNILLDWKWYPYNDLSPKEAFVWLARGIWQEQLDRSEELAALGIYPPKSLNND